MGLPLRRKLEAALTESSPDLGKTLAASLTLRGALAMALAFVAGRLGYSIPDGQAQMFAATAGVTGVVLTKLDGTARGGIALAIARELELPVKLIGIGEAVEDLRPFDPDDFARALIAES